MSVPNEIVNPCFIFPRRTTLIKAIHFHFATRIKIRAVDADHHIFDFIFIAFVRVLRQCGAEMRIRIKGLFNVIKPDAVFRFNDSALIAKYARLAFGLIFGV